MMTRDHRTVQEMGPAGDDGGERTQDDKGKGGSAEAVPNDDETKSSETSARR